LKLRRHLDELEFVATHDELTGLPNRAGFERRLRTVLKRTSSVPAALVLVDVDRFHEINDSLGTSGGDALLKEVAAVLDALAGTSYVARLGEDEFGVVLAGAGLERLREFVSSVQDAFAEPLDVSGVRIAIQPRIGAALAPSHGSDPDQILRRAGIALTAAKDASRSFEVFEESQERIRRDTVPLAVELRDALAEDQLTVYYQPQAEFETGVIRGLEALVRWQHPRHGLLLPDRFIRAAEHSGLISDIDRFVLGQAASDVKRLHQAGSKLTLSVNVSPVDLLDADFADHLDGVLGSTGFPRDHLVLEITERTLLSADRRVLRLLTELARTGIRLSIDDFGTGYSSLARLHQLPIQQVKLDRLFTMATRDPISDAIIRATVGLAHSLNASVVAEGIESPSQWHHLKQLRCDIAQGYLIGKPQPFADITASIRTAAVVAA
jgi:diguanylate cyclase (GGDEF)-like protein